MFLFIFIGFLIGFALSLRFVKRPKTALVWGILLGAIPLALIFGPGNTPIQGIGSILYFALFALGPFVIIPILASSIMLGVAGGAAVLLIGEGRASWVRLSIGVMLVGLVAAFTLLPVAQREIAKRKLANDRDARSEAIMRANFKGTIAGHRVTFPASPRLHLFDDCDDGVQRGYLGCSTSLTNPVTIFTKSDQKLLHERSDPISFNAIRVNALNQDCGLGKHCLTQEKISKWCEEIRPDQANSIWCRDLPLMSFLIQTNANAEKKLSTSNLEELELATLFANTPLGQGQVSCFYHPDPAKTESQGAKCKLNFSLEDEITVTLSVRRAQIISSDPALAETIALISKYWTEITDD